MPLGACDPNAVSRSGENPRHRRAIDDGFDRRCGGGRNMLAIVDHEERAPAGQRFGNGVDDGCAAGGRDAQRVGYRIGHRAPVTDRAKLDHPDPIREFVGQTDPQLDSEAGLADATDAGQGHQLVVED